jgi:hypothetical protein
MRIITAYRRDTVRDRRRRLSELARRGREKTSAWSQ